MAAFAVGNCRKFRHAPISASNGGNGADMGAAKPRSQSIKADATDAYNAGNRAAKNPHKTEYAKKQTNSSAAL